MERRAIGALFADGAELAARLQQNETSIVPQLELIKPDDRDPTTGILLQDIWRYARHYWSIPYQSTPGRNMFYLVRDAAVPTRPLIGIAALGNPVLGSARRDDFYGWSIPGLRERLKKLAPYPQHTIAAHFYNVIVEGIDETYSEDLLPKDWASDWRTTVDLLERLERESASERLSQLERESRGGEYKLIRDAHSAVGRGQEEKVDWQRITIINSVHHS